MTPQDLPPKLYNFLESKGLVETFLEHIGNHLDGTPDLYEVINTAFTWASTLEGHSFWNNINTEWKHYYTQYTRTNNKTNYL